jgi:hypothetical protein
MTIDNCEVDIIIDYKNGIKVSLKNNELDTSFTALSECLHYNLDFGKIVSDELKFQMQFSSDRFKSLTDETKEKIINYVYQEVNVQKNKECSLINKIE